MCMIVVSTASTFSVYAESADGTIESVKSNPAATIPLVINKLRDQHERWKLEKLELDKRWRGTYEEHISKSLDKQTRVTRSMKQRL